MLAGVAETAVWRSREGRRVEPLPRRGTRKHRIAGHIRPVIGAETQLRDAGIRVIVIRQQGDGEWLASLERQYAETLPSAEPAMALEERQIVRVAGREALADVEIGAAAFRAQIMTVLGKVRISGRVEESGSVVNRLSVGIRCQQRQSLP